MSSQMKAADRSGARFVLIVGEDELAAGTVTVRDLRPASGDQAAVPRDRSSSSRSAVSARIYLERTSRDQPRSSDAHRLLR